MPEIVSAHCASQCKEPERDPRGDRGPRRVGRNLVNAVRGHDEEVSFATAETRHAEPVVGFCREQDLRWVGDFDEMLADPALDTVVLATPHSARAAQVIRAVGAGKSVLVEKALVLGAVLGTRWGHSASPRRSTNARCRSGRPKSSRRHRSTRRPRSSLSSLAAWRTSARSRRHCRRFCMAWRCSRQRYALGQRACPGGLVAAGCDLRVELFSPGR